MLAAGRSGILLPGQVRPCAPRQLAVPNGLVNYWGFDSDSVDPTNGIAFDLSGNGNTGTLNAAPKLASGQVGEALSFNGTSQYVRGSVIYNLPVASVSVWVNCSANPSSIGTIAGFINGPASGTHDKVLSVNTNGTVLWSVFDGATKNATSTGTVTDGKWHHVVGTANGSNIVLYIDGVPAATTAAGNTFASYNVPNFFADGANVAFLAASLDEIRIYNRALDPWEVIQLYQAGLAGRRDAGNRFSPINNAMVI